MSLYRGMDRAALDRAYNNSAAVPGADMLLHAWQQRSAAARASLGWQIDLAYGPGPRQRYDWLEARDPDAPVLVFIHGGYWQWCDKEDFSFVAIGPLERGYSVALIEYTLAPAAGIGTIISDVTRALDVIAARAAPRRLCLAGHSAGGHLAAWHRAHPSVAAVAGISGLYDLEPIRLGRLNDALKLTPEDVAAFSPIHHLSPGARLMLSVGAEELPELVRQTDDYAAAARISGEAASCQHIAGCDHFSVLEQLAQPDGAILAEIISAR